MAKKLAKESSKQSISKEKKKATSSFWERKYAFEILIFVFSFLLFANSIPNDYNMDDELVTINHRLTSKGISAIPEIFTSPYYEDASGYSYEYRPVVLTSFAIEHDIFGENPHWGHFWNVILYGLTCVLLFRVLKLLFRNYSPILSLAITLLFVAHPAHTEVVCSIKNRDEILGLLFSLLAFYFAIKSVLERKRGLLILVPIFFILSLLSKLTLASFFIIIPIALVFFCAINLTYLIIITTSLLLPLLIIAAVGNTFVKFYIISAVILVVITTYGLFNLSKIRRFILKLISNQLEKIDDLNSEEMPSTELKFFLKNILAPFSLKQLKYITVGFGVFVLFLIGTIYNIYSIQIFIAIFLVLSFFIKKEEVQWSVICTIYSIIFFRAYYFNFLQIDFFIELISIPVIYTLLLGKRSFFIPSLFFLICIATVNVFKSNSSSVLFFLFQLLAVMYLQRFRYGWLVILISMVTAFSILPKSIPDFLEAQFNPLLTSILLIAIFFRKQHQIIAKGYFIISLLVVVIYHPQISTPSPIIQAVQNSTRVSNDKALSKEIKRPIHYVENCVDNKTQQSVKAAISLNILFSYLVKVVVPYPLSFYYGYSFIKPVQLSETIPIISFFFHLFLILICLLAIRKNKLLSFGLTVYLSSIVTFSNFFQSVPGMIADRFLLIPSLGWLIVLVVLISGTFKISKEQFKWQDTPQFAKYLFVAIFLLYSSLTFSRNFKWKNHLTLYRQDINYVDNSAQAHNLLALRLMKESFNEGMLPNTQLDYRKGAAIHFRRAIEIYPPFFNANYDLGRTYQLLGNIDSAIYFYKKTVLIDSSFTNASLSVGELLVQQNKAKEAIPYFRSVIREFPTDFTGYDKLSYALFLEKDYSGSIEALKVANEKMPQNPQPRISIAKLYYSTTKMDSAKYWLQQAIEIEPNNQEARGLLRNLESR